MGSEDLVGENHFALLEAVLEADGDRAFALDLLELGGDLFKLVHEDELGKRAIKKSPFFEIKYIIILKYSIFKYFNFN